MTTARALTRVAITEGESIGLSRACPLVLAQQSPYSLGAMRCRARIVFILLLSGALAIAEDFDPMRFIGMDPENAFGAIGAPREVFPLRGGETAEDNVVFFYPDFMYLFWYDNRVWQVRCDRRFASSVLGFSLGMDRKTVEGKSQRSLSPLGDSLYFSIDTGQYPLRVRLVFVNEALSDIYVYRSDY